MKKPIYSGNTWIFEITVTDSNGNSVLNLKKYSLKFICVNRTFSINKIYNENELILVGDKTIIITIPKESTFSAPAGIYDYEVEITSPQGESFTIVRQKFTVIKSLIGR